MDQQYGQEQKKQKKFKPNSVISSLILIVLGLILVIIPNSSINIICAMVCIVALVIGIVYLTTFFVKKKGEDFSTKDISIAITAFICAIVVFILMWTSLNITLIPFVLGIIVLVSGVFKLYTAIEIIHMKGDGLIPVIIAVVNIALGIVLIIFPFEVGNVLYIVMGVALIFSGVAGLFSSIKLGKSANNFERPNMEDAVDVEYRDIPPHE